MADKNSAKLTKSGLWLTSSFATVKVTQFVAQVLLARVLLPEDFGIWGMVLIITTLSRLFKDNAVSAVLIQRGLEDKKCVDTVYSLGINISIGMFLLQAALGYPLATFFNAPIVGNLTALVSLTFLIGAGAGTRTAIMQRNMQFRELAITSAAMGVNRMLVTIVCALMGLGVWSFAIAEVAMEVVRTIMARLYCNHQLDYHLKLDIEAVKDVSGFIGSMMGINLAVYANTNGDNLLIGKLIGPAALGYYNVAYQLSMLPTFALSQVNKIVFSVMSQRDDRGQLSFLGKSIGMYAIFYAPLFGISLIAAPWMIPAVYGSNWVPAVRIFQIITVFSYLRGFMSILGTALNAKNKADINAFINWGLVPISAVAFFIGAKLGGIEGVAYMVALVMGLGATLWFWIVTCRVSNWPLKVLIKPSTAPTLATVIAVLCSFPLTGDTAFKALFASAVFLVVYLLLASILSKGEIPRLIWSLTSDLLQSSKKKFIKSV